MLNQIKGLHHVTSLAADARSNNRFFTDILGLRRVKKTVNFDDPSVYHLYYGDELGTPGTVMTYFPFPGMPRGRDGTGEVGRRYLPCRRVLLASGRIVSSNPPSRLNPETRRSAKSVSISVDRMATVLHWLK